MGYHGAAGRADVDSRMQAHTRFAKLTAYGELLTGIGPDAGRLHRHRRRLRGPDDQELHAQWLPQ